MEGANFQELPTRLRGLPTDVNECWTSPGRLCQHTCENTLGSYRCSCASGFQLAADGKHCKGTGPGPLPRPSSLSSWERGSAETLGEAVHLSLTTRPGKGAGPAMGQDLARTEECDQASCIRQHLNVLSNLTLFSLIHSFVL